MRRLYDNPLIAFLLPAWSARERVLSALCERAGVRRRWWKTQRQTVKIIIAATCETQKPAQNGMFHVQR